MAMKKIFSGKDADKKEFLLAPEIWGDERFAKLLACTLHPGSNLCVSVHNQNKDLMGCYSAEDCLGASLKDIKPCRQETCGEKRDHIHGFLDGELDASAPTTLGNLADKIKEICLIKCDCSAPAGAAANTGALAGNRIPESVTLDVVGTKATTVMNVAGICCPSEIPIINNILNKLPGVEKVSVNVTMKTTSVEHDPVLTPASALVSALNAASLSASLKRGDDEPPQHPWPSPLLILCGVLWVVSLCHLGADADADPKPPLYYLKYVAIVAVVFGVPRIAMKAFGALKNKVLDINCLMVLATAGAVGIGDYSEAAAVVFLFGLSEWLEHMATAKARNALQSLLKMKPDNATLAKTGKIVPVEEVQLGDILAVKAGEKVPVDGTVTEGASSLDEAALSGESAPVEKRVGAKVSAGGINVGGGYMEIECTAVAKDSAVARMVRLIEDAHSSRSRTEKRVEVFAKIYTPVVVFGAVCLATVPWIWMTEEKALEWVYTALVLLVVACPCALVISTPVTYVSTLTTAATHNILIRGGEHLETLGSISAIGLDKTGTLTEGRFAVRQVLGPFEGQGVPQEMDKLLSLMAAVERKSTHPVAAALVGHSLSEGADMTLKAEGMVDTAGEGVSADVSGLSVQVGSRRLAQRMGWLPQEAALDSSAGDDSQQSLIKLGKDVQKMEESGFTVCYLGVAGHLALVFGVADAPRPEAAEAVRELKKYGVETVMLTGDRQITAKAIAQTLGITKVKAELLPEDKLAAVIEMKQEFRRRTCFGYSEGKIAMVGDGINDAAALAASSVGVAMGAAGTQVAMENAHVVLLDSDLLKLGKAVMLGRYAVTTIRQNIAFALVSKLAMLGITLAGYASLWVAIVADLGAMLLVTLNASTVLSERKQKGQHKHGGHGHSHGGKACDGSAHAPAAGAPAAGGHGHAHGKKACCGAAPAPACCGAAPAPATSGHGHAHGGEACDGSAHAPAAGGHGQGHGQAHGEEACCGSAHAPAAGGHGQADSGHGHGHGHGH